MKKKLDFEQVFILGGTGQVGHRLIENLISDSFELPSSVKVFATSRDTKNGLPEGGLAPTILDKAKKWGSRVTWTRFDLEKTGPAFEEQFKTLEPLLNTKAKTLFLIAASYTNVEGCEIDPTLCERINEINTKKVLAFFTDRYRSKNVFFSTDYVFDGESGPYKEEDFTNPLSKYGQSKLFIEDVLLRDDLDALIVRTTGVYDYLPGSKNFLMQMLLLWGDKKQTTIPSDQYSNPVWAHELALATLELLALKQSGLIHIAGGEYLPRDQFARQIAQVFNHDKSLITPILTSEMNQKANRPLKGGLAVDKLKRILSWAPRKPLEVLAEFAKN